MRESPHFAGRLRSRLSLRKNAVQKAPGYFFVGHSGGQFSSEICHTKNSPDCAGPVSRAKSSDFPLGEKSAPTFILGWLISGASLVRGDQPVLVRCDS